MLEWVLIMVVLGSAGGTGLVGVWRLEKRLAAVSKTLRGELSREIAWASREC